MLRPGRTLSSLLIILPSEKSPINQLWLFRVHQRSLSEQASTHTFYQNPLMNFTERLSVEAPEAIRLWFKIAPTWKKREIDAQLQKGFWAGCHTNTQPVHSGGDCSSRQNTQTVPPPRLCSWAEAAIRLTFALSSFHSRGPSALTASSSVFFWSIIILFIFSQHISVVWLY